MRSRLGKPLKAAILIVGIAISLVSGDPEARKNVKTGKQVGDRLEVRRVHKVPERLEFHGIGEEDRIFETDESIDDSEAPRPLRSVHLTMGEREMDNMLMMMLRHAIFQVEMEDKTLEVQEGKTQPNQVKQQATPNEIKQQKPSQVQKQQFRSQQQQQQQQPVLRPQQQQQLLRPQLQQQVQLSDVDYDYNNGEDDNQNVQKQSQSSPVQQPQPFQQQQFAKSPKTPTPKIQQNLKKNPAPQQQQQQNDQQQKQLARQQKQLEAQRAEEQRRLADQERRVQEQLIRQEEDRRRAELELERQRAIEAENQRLVEEQRRQEQIQLQQREEEERRQRLRQQQQQKQQQQDEENRKRLRQQQQEEENKKKLRQQQQEDEENRKRLRQQQVVEQQQRLQLQQQNDQLRQPKQFQQKPPLKTATQVQPPRTTTNFQVPNTNGILSQGPPIQPQKLNQPIRTAPSQANGNPSVPLLVANVKVPKQPQIPISNTIDTSSGSLASQKLRIGKAFSSLSPDIPVTSFSCSDQQYPGLYADPEADCQVFHMCQTSGRYNSFLCPEGTSFDQRHLVCNWKSKVNCGESVQYYSLNKDIYS